MSVRLLFLATFTITILAGGTAAWLANGRSSTARRVVADRLAQVALLGAAAIIALLQAVHDS